MYYQAWDQWNPAVHALSTSTTTFPSNWLDLITRNRVQWWYFPTLNQYVRMDQGGNHAIERAMELIFGETRAKEIVDLCERFGPWRRSLGDLKLVRAKRKLQAAVDAGHVTAGEALQLRDLVEHIMAV